MRTDHPSNRLLNSLPPDARHRLLSISRRVDLPVGTVLYGARQRPDQAFFLDSGFASQVVTTPDAGSAEVGMVSREGVVGDWALLGAATATAECFMQSDGTGYCLPFEQLQQAFRDSSEIRSRLLECVQQQAASTTYLGACNKLHDTEARLARWLLMVQDRLQTEVLSLKQEFLAQMLGTRRMTVTTTAGAFQRKGWIEYKRGSVRILDRKALERTACECYGRLRALNEGLYRSSSTQA